jgi:hypothetical protein
MRPSAGFKLANPLVSGDGEAGFSGVAAGLVTVYGVVAEAECVQGRRDRSPSRWCECGFFCVRTLEDARALTLDPDYRHEVLLEVAVSGRVLPSGRGLRYAEQRVTRVRVGRCGCGKPATRFLRGGAGLGGWIRLVAVCSTCPGDREVLTLDAYSRLLGGVPVVRDAPSEP